MFNLNVYTLNLAAGKEQPDMRGLWAAPPPRRLARNRSGDLLVLFLKLEGQASFTDAQEKEILQKVAGAFYGTAGSVTLALRAAAGSLNELLLSRNLKQAKDGGQVTAVVDFAVLHGDLLYVAQCGPTQAFILGHDSVQICRDASLDRGLGLSKTVPIRFYQAQVQAGDLLLISHRPPNSWTADALAGSPLLGMDHLRRRILNQAGNNLEAVIVRLETGKGEITISPLPGPQRASPREAVEEAAVPQEVTPPPVPVVDVEESQISAEPVKTVEQTSIQEKQRPVQSERPEKEKSSRTDAGLIQRLQALRQKNVKEQPAAPVEEEKPQGIYLTGDLQRRIDTAIPVEQPPQIHRRPAMPVHTTVVVEEEEEEELPEKPSQPVKVKQPRNSEASVQAKRVVSKLWVAGGAARRKTALFGRKTLIRLAPTQKEELPRVSPATMWFTALAIPLVIAVVAATVYIRKGYGEQHQVYLAQAQGFANQAINQQDVVLRRQDWMQALQWVSKADEYGQSSESTRLRNQVQQALDSIDGIRRIEFQPASPTSFDRQIQISEMVTSGDDIYVLDKNQGRIFRMAYQRPAYEIDPQFNCGPGQITEGGLIIGKLVDLEPVAPNNIHGATVMGLDQMGNLLFCAPNHTPEAITLAAPDSGWYDLTHMTISSNTLYVLDPQIPGVWRYPGNGVDFFEAPRLFFDQEIPPLQDVIDLAVYQDDLFLLHQDGHMTKCTYSEFDFSPTRCTDPFPFNMQPGRQDSQPVNTIGQPLIQVQTTESPAYSLFLFNADAPAIYHFSLALNLQSQYRPSLDANYALPQRPATAFTITPSRRVIIAFGNEVFYGNLP